MFAHVFIVSDFRYIRQCAQNSLTQDHGGLHKGGGVQKFFFLLGMAVAFKVS